MPKLAHQHTAIVTFLLTAVFGAWFVGAITSAVSQVSVSVTGATDVCSNIPGVQVSVPVGMVTDGSGNCYTPTPPPVDVCDNIPGNQGAIPSGYYRDSSGDCYVQPAPPVDVCPNLPGVQPLVPLGYTNDALGNCVATPKDQCANIPGVQNAVPAGMQRSDEGVCSTPAVVPGPTQTPPGPFETPETPREPAGKSYANVPAAFSGLVGPLVELVPENIKANLRALPPIVAQTFPYYVVTTMGLGAAALSWQAFREAAAMRGLFLILKREKEIAEEKDNFVALASHYLRTPLTVMTTGLDTLVAVKEVTSEQVAPLRAPIQTLDARIKSILGDIDGNTALQGIEAPPDAGTPPQIFKSFFFWLPIIASIVIMTLANFFLGVVGEVEIGGANLGLQMMLFFAVVFFLYSAIRNRYIRRERRRYNERLISHQRVVDDARTRFIDQATAALNEGLTAINAQRAVIANARSAHFFDDGYSRFASILEKFALLTQIRNGSEIQEEEFNLHEAVDSAIAKAQSVIEGRQITVVNNTQSVMVTQRRQLFEFVLASLVDNAIKFSHSGGTVQINSSPSQHKISFRVSDYGVGIPNEKLSQLFKPFSRADSALEFNYEGLGFSLFLDKIIMDYIGGSIQAQSEVEKGSTFTVTALVGKPSTA